MSDSEVVENFRSGRFSIRYSNELSRCTGVGARKLESGEVVGDSPAPDGDPVDPVDAADPVDPGDPADPVDPADPADPADAADPAAAAAAAVAAAAAASAGC